MAFKAPCDCNAVAGLKAYFPNEAGIVTNQVFLFTDAHGNNLTGIGHLFAAGAIVKVILNIDEGKAYIQNADTNAYLEGKFEEKADLVDGKVPAEQLPAMDYIPTTEKGAASGVATLGADGKVPTGQLPSMGYNKVETLTDATKSLFGFGASAVPSDVFSWVGNYNQHWWARRFNRSHYVEVLGELSSTVNIMSVPNSKYTAYAVYYYDSVSFDSNGNFVLGTEHTVTFSYSESTSANVLKGKYFYETSNGTKITSTLYYMPSNAANVTQQIDGSWYRVLGSAQVVSKRFVETTEEWEYIQAPERNRYPDTGVVDSVEYRYFGIPFDNAVTAPRIATGNYTGTGTYGESNPNSITFNFEPKLVFMVAENNGTTYSPYGNYSRYGVVPFYLMPQDYAMHWGFSGNESYAPYGKRKGNTMYWYNTKGASYQYNASGNIYYWLAIG